MSSQTSPRGQFLDRRSPPNIFTLILLAGVSALCMNIFLPSLPSMTAYFDTDYGVMQLSIAVYLAVNAVLQIVVGPISDKFGRRPVILSGMAIFLLATLGCIYAPNAAIFLTFRMLQAAVVVAMVLSRAVVRDMVPTDQAASMIGYVTMGMTVVPMIGPALGGLLDATFGWQASFWMLFLLGLAIFWITYRDLGETKTSSGLTLPQQFREYPELLTSPRFWGYSLANGFTSGAFFAYLGGAPFVATEFFGMSATKMGVYFGAPALGYFIGNFLSGRYSARFGVNRMVFTGCAICGLGIAASLSIFAAGLGSAEIFFGFMTFVGIGNGLAIPNATAGALSVRPHLAGTAAGLSGAIMIGGGAALSALAGALLTTETGAFPLLWLMLATSVLGVTAIAMVIRREKMLGL
ncbi:multidrug effflux MFS transporter [Shimia marina]|uniref:Bcr/CflA family efflux transporter n=1 Tax=Shimia marina TaxID=321267 RepID=A0A0N7LS71_9RHOB|nr:multidrug effflux MFS transporter [Shimia marina]CUH52804.1 Sulfonamide resistance protein [Shimia marina]SFD88098.1 MFS transporter, DHA1 family, bicyclomycin/chloramphenicol resistance protein [Shimia marina]